MSLQNQISSDLIKHLKNRDSDRVKVLRFLQAGIKNKIIELRSKALNDEQVLSVLQKQIKQINESLGHLKKAGYTDQIKDEQYQLGILEAYLPKQISKEELHKLVSQSIIDLKAQSIKDMGSIMQAVLAKTKGACSAQTLSQLVRQELSKL